MTDTERIRYRCKWRSRKQVGDRVVETRYTEGGRTEVDVTAVYVPRPPEPSKG